VGFVNGTINRLRDKKEESMEPLEQAEQFKLNFVPEQSDSSLRVFKGDQWLLKAVNGTVLGEFKNVKAIAYSDHHSTKIDDVALGSIDSHSGFAGCGNFHQNVPMQWNSDSVFPNIKAIMVRFSAATWEGC